MKDEGPRPEYSLGHGAHALIPPSLPSGMLCGPASLSPFLQMTCYLPAVHWAVFRSGRSHLPGLELHVTPSLPTDSFSILALTACIALTFQPSQWISSTCLWNNAVLEACTALIKKKR